MHKKPNGAFTLIEVIVVICVLALLALIAVPQFSAVSDRAKKSATVASTRSVISTIQGAMALYEKEDWYAPRNSGTSYDYSQGSMNNYLERLFENTPDPTNDFTYVNQYSENEVIVNWTSSISGEGLDPAIFLTDSETYSFNNSTASTMSQLKGSIIVYFAADGETTSHIEVYYTDENGVKCEEPFILTM